MQRKILGALAGLLLWTLVSEAAPWWASGLKPGSSASDFLAPDQAFQPQIRLDGRLLRVHWRIAPGYYLYRSRFEITPESPDLEMEAANFPRGEMKNDPYLGTQEIYKEDVEAVMGYSQADAGAHSLQVKLTYQGCAEAGLCYLPIVKILGVQPSAGNQGSRSSGHVSLDPNGVVAGVAAGICGFFLAGLWLRRKKEPSAPGVSRNLP